MDERQLVRVSKFLSRHLRHEPEGLGLELEPGGWVPVDALLAGCARKGMRISRAELMRLEARCLRATVAQRRRFRGLQPDRADIMPAGLAVLIAFARHARTRSLNTFEGGWREGLILERAARTARRSPAKTRSRARRPAGARTGR